MPQRARRRTFGALRRLPSGRWQARYRGGDGRVRSAPTTFASRADAERLLAQMDLDRARGGWVDPDAGAVPLSPYVEQWLVERPEPLRPRTVERYRGLLRLHILSTFGPVHLNRITSAAVQPWHASLRRRGVGDSTVAKTYRLLKAILNTAVEDDLIGRNPCRLRHAGVERPDERRPPSLAELDAIADAMEPRFRLLALLAPGQGAVGRAARAESAGDRPDARADPRPRAAGASRRRPPIHGAAENERRCPVG